MAPLSGNTIRNIMAEAAAPELVMRIISPQGKTIQEKPVHATTNDVLFLLPADLPKAA